VVAPAQMPLTLLDWTAMWPGARRWAIEGSDRLGRLLARELIVAGATVIEVPATLAAQASPGRSL
jgi:hypothetical protein